MRYSEIFERVELISIDSYATKRGRIASDRVKKVKLFVNPTKAELARLATIARKIRFIIGEDDNLYICNAEDATHFDIVHHAGIDEKYAGFIEPNHISIRASESVRELAPLLRANSHVLDVMGGASFMVDRNHETMSDF
jgi:hypothetical protein